MVNPFLKTDYHFDTENGIIISEKHRRLAEIIADYNSELSVMWIPPSDRDETDVFPFVIVHTPSNGHQYPVMYLTADEFDNPPGVLARLFAGDIKKHKPNEIIDEIELQEKAQRIYRAKEKYEASQEQMDLIKTMIDSPLHTFRHNGRKYHN